MLAGLFFSILALLRSSDAYTGAIARAKSAPAVREAVGSPIQEKLIFTGHIKFSGSSGRANFAIPIEGSKARATIHVVARKVDGRWHYDRLIIQAQDGTQLDISEK